MTRPQTEPTATEILSGDDVGAVASIYYGILDRIIDWHHASADIVVAPIAADGSTDWERATPLSLEKPSSDSGPADMAEARRWAILVDDIDACASDTSLLVWIDPITGNPMMEQVAGPASDSDIAMRIVGRDIGALPPPVEYKPGPLASSLLALVANDNVPGYDKRLIPYGEHFGGGIRGNTLFSATVDGKPGQITFLEGGQAWFFTNEGAKRVRLPESRKRLRATAFALRASSAIPPREWLHAHHYMRRYLTVTVGAGGGGKSAHAISEVLAMVTGRPLLDPDGPLTKPLRVWYVNAEDPADEIERRFTAAAMHFNIGADQIADRLFTDSGREQEFVIVRQEGRDYKVCEPMVEEMLAVIRDNGIDVVIVDPFVSTHEVPENDNGLMQRVAKAWRRVADEGNCSVELIHHVTKGNFEITADSARGGGALKDAARSVRTINPMTRDEADKAGLDGPHGYFRLDFGKANMVASSGSSAWRHFVSVPLGNGRGLIKSGDLVGVVDAWRWPSRDDIADREAAARRSLVGDVSSVVLDGIKRRLGAADYKAHEQAKNWAGIVVAELLGIDLAGDGGRARVREMIAAWIAEGHFEIVELQDHRRHVTPHLKPCAT